METRERDGERKEEREGSGGGSKSTVGVEGREEAEGTH